MGAMLFFWSMDPAFRSRLDRCQWHTYVCVKILKGLNIEYETIPINQVLHRDNTSCIIAPWISAPEGGPVTSVNWASNVRAATSIPWLDILFVRMLIRQHLCRRIIAPGSSEQTCHLFVLSYFSVLLFIVALYAQPGEPRGPMVDSDFRISWWYQVFFESF